MKCFRSNLGIIGERMEQIKTADIIRVLDLPPGRACSRRGGHPIA